MKNIQNKKKKKRVPKKRIFFKSEIRITLSRIVTEFGFLHSSTKVYFVSP